MPLPPGLCPGGSDYPYEIHRKDAEGAKGLKRIPGFAENTTA
jgi:hypothetical protein